MGRAPSPLDEELSESFTNKLRTFYASKVWWRARVISLAGIVGLLCGVVCAVYEVILDAVLDLTWVEGSTYFQQAYPDPPPWTYILVVCPALGLLVGVLLRVLGEPAANLPCAHNTQHEHIALTLTLTCRRTC